VAMMLMTIKWVAPGHHFASSPIVWIVIITSIVVGVLLLRLLHRRS
jgi:hypothetical protein